MLKQPLLVLTALATSAAADPQPYMKRANPNDLPLLVEAAGCPVDAAAVRAMAESVMTQARVRPSDPAIVEVPPAFPWLYVNVHCLDGGAVFRTDVDFLALQGGDLVRMALSGYGGFGAAPKDRAYILNAIKQRVEAAINDYVKANAEPTVTPEPSRRSNRTR